MKKLFTIPAIMLAALVTKNANAQVGIHVNLNIGHPRPVMVAPAPVYDDYYYLPEVEAYYSVPQHMYYYMDGGRWTSAAYLPGRYRNYDWRTARRVEIRGERPYMNHNTYKQKYGGFNSRFNDRDGYANNRRPQQYDNRWNNNDDRRDKNGWGNDRNDRNDRGRGRY